MTSVYAFMSATKLIIASSAIVLMAAAFVVAPRASDAAEKTDASVAALKANLGNPKDLVIDEVRVTDAGIACIEYCC